MLLPLGSIIKRFVDNLDVCWGLLQPTQFFYISNELYFGNKVLTRAIICKKNPLLNRAFDTLFLSNSVDTKIMRVIFLLNGNKRRMNQ